MAMKKIWNCFLWIYLKASFHYCAFKWVWKTKLFEISISFVWFYRCAFCNGFIFKIKNGYEKKNFRANLREFLTRTWTERHLHNTGPYINNKCIKLSICHIFTSTLALQTVTAIKSFKCKIKFLHKMYWT